MNKNIWILIILAIIIVVLTGFLFWPAKNNRQSVIAPTAGITINSIKSGEEISSPLKITGIVNGDGWVGFEGQVGTVKLLDNAGKELSSGILNATTEWTTLPTNFETTLNFTANNSGPATLIFKNENPSGDPSRDKTFSLPVTIKAGAETTTVKVYFQDPVASNTNCKAVKSAERTVPKTQAVARAALERLLLGPTSEEKQIYITSINSGVKIQSLTIENETAYVDFDETLEKNVGGSCRVASIRAEITETLKQFSTVKNVVISINGRTEDILQP